MITFSFALAIVSSSRLQKIILFVNYLRMLTHTNIIHVLKNLGVQCTGIVEKNSGQSPSFDCNSISHRTSGSTCVFRMSHSELQSVLLIQNSYVCFLKIYFY